MAALDDVRWIRLRAGTDQQCADIRDKIIANPQAMRQALVEYFEMYADGRSSEWSNPLAEWFTEVGAVSLMGVMAELHDEGRI